MDILILGIPVGFLVGYYNGCFGYCPGFKKQVDDWIASIVPPKTAAFSHIQSSFNAPMPVVASFKRDVPYVLNEPISPVIIPKMSTSSRVGDLRSQLTMKRRAENYG